jgi:ABC-type Fe3+-hydroxamate transport system substrate-binding protein
MGYNACESVIMRIIYIVGVVDVKRLSSRKTGLLAFALSAAIALTGCAAKEGASGQAVQSDSLPQLDADHLIILPSNGTWAEAGNEQALQELLKNSVWQTVPAVKKGNVYPVERSYWQTGAIMANYQKMDELLKLFAN